MYVKTKNIKCQKKKKAFCYYIWTAQPALKLLLRKRQTALAGFYVIQSVMSQSTSHYSTVRVLNLTIYKFHLYENSYISSCKTVAHYKRRLLQSLVQLCLTFVST